MPSALCSSLHLQRKSALDFALDLKLILRANDKSRRDYWEEAGDLLAICGTFHNFLEATGSGTKADDLQRDGQQWMGE